ncbi:MAG: hypothetical protein OEZ68_14355 [Gammaproteobacteria bacterium]|nr:hypothetical protein [Gammaproteobacteria bacterium]MDH5801986.1 hypothetical protein [Gammaproteobacteria bacterium]
MGILNDELLKRRDIPFCPIHPDSDQAKSAAMLLLDVPGITQVRPLSNRLLHIEYNIKYVTLRALEEALREVGYHLDNSLFNKIRRALIYYCEETQLANLGYDHSDSKSTTEIFTSKYANREHGCRDERPPYYRNYN